MNIAQNIALLISIVGLLIYWVCSNSSAKYAAQAAETGRLMFFAGLLAYLLK